jgi:hypothetical protein
MSEEGESRAADLHQLPAKRFVGAGWPSYDDLKAHFGKHAVYRDVESMRPGIDWLARIKGELVSAAAVVAVIGESWSESVDEEGRRRLDLPGDYVRFELASALAAWKPVIPVLVAGARAVAVSVGLGLDAQKRLADLLRLDRPDPASIDIQHVVHRAGRSRKDGAAARRARAEACARDCRLGT